MRRLLVRSPVLGRVSRSGPPDLDSWSQNWTSLILPPEFRGFNQYVFLLPNVPTPRPSSYESARVFHLLSKYPSSTDATMALSRATHGHRLYCVATWATYAFNLMPERKAEQWQSMNQQYATWKLYNETWRDIYWWDVTMKAQRRRQSKGILCAGTWPAELISELGQLNGLFFLDWVPANSRGSNTVLEGRRYILS